MSTLEVPIEYRCPFMNGRACLKAQCRVWDAVNERCSLREP